MTRANPVALALLHMVRTQEVTEIVVTEGSYNHEMILKMYGNKDIISVAKLGKAFLPLYVEAGNRCADIYYYMEEGTLYLAIFNFDGLTDSSVLDLTTLIGTDAAHATELWSGEVTNLEEGTLRYKLAAEDAAVYKITAGTISTPSDDNTNPPEGDGSATIPGDNNSETDNENNNETTENNNEIINKEEDGTPWIVILIIAVFAVVTAGIVFAVLRKKK